MGAVLCRRPEFVVRPNVPGQDAAAEWEFDHWLRLPRKALNQLWGVFLSMDVNGDMVVTEDEFLAVFKLDRSPFFDRLFAHVRDDPTVDSGITFQQFVRAVFHISSLDYGGIARLVFESVADQQGFVGLHELRKLGAEMVTNKQAKNKKLVLRLEASLSPDSHRNLLASQNISFDLFCKYTEATPAILDHALNIQSHMRRFTLGEEAWLALTSVRVARGHRLPVGLAMFMDPAPKSTPAWWLPSPTQVALVRSREVSGRPSAYATLTAVSESPSQSPRLRAPSRRSSSPPHPVWNAPSLPGTVTPRMADAAEGAVEGSEVTSWASPPEAPTTEPQRRSPKLQPLENPPLPHAMSQ